MRTLADDVLRSERLEQVALVDADAAVTYGELAARVLRRADEFELDERSVVALTGATSVEFVVTYLALIEAGHVPLLAGDRIGPLVDAWSPAAIAAVTGGGVEIRRRSVAPVALHPELALLLTTSGSTGSPKLVRLSHRNLTSNASAIVESLGLTARDRGITSLPLHYCYGLSVLHSHLVAGASLVVSGASVVDPCFAAAFVEHSVTNLAGVPHTYEMLERSDTERFGVPSLRLLTQAGGRLAPEAVQRWTARADRWDAEFVVMYGQTEATARMAYLPTHLARRHPGAIGVPIPGGSITLRPVTGHADDVGELVYQGPNVMLGYATSPVELSLGATVDELRTGDLGRYDETDGVFEIVGRRSRFVKPFGLRIDLDAVELHLRDALDDADVAVAGDDEHLVVAAPDCDVSRARQAVCTLTGLPASRVVVVGHCDVPRTTSGKIDHGAVLALGTEGKVPPPSFDAPVPPSSRDPSAAVAAVYATVLGRHDVAESDSFVSLGGDSLSYVECSLRLEEALGRVPADWHLRPVGELGHVAPRQRVARIDTTAVLRAVGICAVVATHMHLQHVPGGAHLLLAVVGYNLARFMLPIESPRKRFRAGMRTAARAAVPTVAWVATGMLVAGSYSSGTLLLINNYAGPASHQGDHWHFWFIEAFVHLVVLTTVVMAIPAVRRVERRFPYGFALSVLVGTLLLRLEWAQIGDWYNVRYRTHGIAWFFVLGWLVQRSSTTRQRLLTSVLCVAVIPGFFDFPQREWSIVAALVMLVWWRELPMPRVMARPIGVVGAASMWIFITHFTLWPPLDRHLDRGVAYVATIASGVAIWAFVRWATQTGLLIARLRLAHAAPARAEFGYGSLGSPLGWRRAPWPVHPPPIHPSLSREVS